MKNRIIYILFATLSAALNFSCTNDTTGSRKEEKLQKLFTEQDEIGIMKGEKMITTFDSSCDQVVFDEDRSMYMVSNMESSNFFLVEFDGGIYLDNSINATFSSKGINEISRGSAVLKVIKIDSTNSRYWLWDSELKIGFIIDYTI